MVVSSVNLTLPGRAGGVWEGDRKEGEGEKEWWRGGGGSRGREGAGKGERRRRRREEGEEEENSNCLVKMCTTSNRGTCTVIQIF